MQNSAEVAHSSHLTIESYSEQIKSASQAEILSDCTLNGNLILAREGSVSVSYAPFEYINKRARIVLVGITPGRKQAIEALLTFREALLNGLPRHDASQLAKERASFVGNMRSNLARMFDHVGLHELLGIASCSMLFGDDRHLVHYTSALRYPVFVGSENYSGQPRMTAVKVLSEMILKYLAEEARVLQSAIWIPLGPLPAAALDLLVEVKLLDPRQILAGFPHASGANAERIAYFVQTKSRHQLSRKTRPEKIDDARKMLISRISELREA